jgi:hypothetical protein
METIQQGFLSLERRPSDERGEMEPGKIVERTEIDLVGSQGVVRITLDE